MLKKFLYRAWLFIITFFSIACLFHIYNYYNRNHLTTSNSRTMSVNYEGYSVILDCDKNAAIMTKYTTGKDMGNQKRENSFYFAPDIPFECQQSSTKPYGHNYDRGHLVPANHMDFSRKAIHESNYMVNILPQTEELNRQTWHETEKLIECLRDSRNLAVFAGPIWDSNNHNPNNNHFFASHNIKKPHYFWKVVVDQSNGHAISWIMPNTHNVNENPLNYYRSTIDEIEKKTGLYLKTNVSVTNEHTEDWIAPDACNLG